MNNHTVITISRQYGSGGRELANKIAEKLGYKLYDRQIVHMAAAQLGISGMSESQLKEFEDNVPPLSLKFMPFYIFGMSGAKPMNHKMFEQESEIIRRLAKDGKCIILGRCADAVLQGNENVCSVFVCANDEYREKRGKEVYEGKTLKELDAENEKRARYYNYYTGKKWGEASNYDLIVNTSNASLDKIADAIIEYINKVQE